MKQDAFEAAHSRTWSQFESWIAILSNKSEARNKDPKVRAEIGAGFPALYRQVCHHLSLARARRYSIALEHRLNQLALDGHQHLYRGRTAVLGSIGRFLAFDFPRTFRARWRYMLAATLVFYLPAFGMGLAVQLQPDLIYSILDPYQVAEIEAMYALDNTVLGRTRASDTDVYMFGYYIYNNISIGFRTFAGGLLFGIGSLFFLSFNGLYIGSIASYLTDLNYIDTFWPFVAGHSAFELTAITIFGGVGLMLGYGAIAPGRKGRWQAIRDQAVSGLPLVYGGTLMLVAAAFIEAFWSSTTWPPIALKYVVGAVLWTALGVYFALFGRNEP